MRYLIILTYVLTFIALIYYNLDYNQIKWEGTNKINKNIDLQTHANMNDIDLWQIQPDGLVVIRFYANNSIGQEGFIDLQVIKDTIRPTIVILSPQNGTIVGELPPDFNVTIFDINFQKFWFIFNTSDEIYFWRINSGNNIVWLPVSEWKTIPQGNLLVRFFVNDTAGNSNSFDIRITKQLTEREKGIPGINSSVLFLVLIMTSIVIIRSSFVKNKNL